MIECLYALALTAAVPSPTALATQDTTKPQRVRIVGRVLDGTSRRGIPGVTIELAELGLQVSTDVDGRFEITDLLPGVYRLSLRAAGYRPAEGDLTVMRDGEFITTMEPIDVGAAVPPGRLVGTVTQAGSDAPVRGVRVRVPDVYLDGLTGDEGRFSFESVPPGRHAVHFSGLGYASRVVTVEVVSGVTTIARVTLGADPLEVDSLTVTVERREPALERNGFYERRDLGFGLFIDREFIEEWHPQGITDLLDRLPGVERHPDPSSPLRRAIMLRGGRDEGCYPTVYVDGVRVHRASTEPVYLDELLGPTEVAGIEVFRSVAEVPIRFGGSNPSCGVLVVWTR